MWRYYVSWFLGDCTPWLPKFLRSLADFEVEPQLPKPKLCSAAFLARLTLSTIIVSYRDVNGILIAH
jgi:hypothetical protein